MPDRGSREQEFHKLVREVGDISQTDFNNVSNGDHEKALQAQDTIRDAIGGKRDQMAKASVHLSMILHWREHPKNEAA